MTLPRLTVAAGAALGYYFIGVRLLVKRQLVVF
jgi:hypothetical protein